ncbi:deoxyhypusine hydroxylase [Pyrrhoderma noxium]|uniref:Deoxyhypusine hydroxylase n=1 Tax=Pyrrhoderma noxium TaxID=2282107 RepID=A0A286UD67_9AGAM|nr:deoxyhypusine hydroxylase [Pyrrhoderma noxium]
MFVSDETYSDLRSTLLNISGSVPLHERFRALFTLKSLKSDRAIEIISEGFKDESALLKHELAYCLGQIESESALPVLESVLGDKNEDPMVRHEAAEALGAISAESALPILREYLNDEERAVRETCEIAIDKIIWDHSEEGKAYHAKLEKDKEEEVPITYTSIDPAPPSSDKTKATKGSSGLLSGRPNPTGISPSDVPALRATLLDTKLPLFERYRAMFALRNIGTAAAVDALADGLKDDSALFKHEIAFVFGQLLSPHSVPALLRVLQDGSEQEMVRHEAAEALGGIATPEVLPHLKEWMSRTDAPRVVRESCMVALDMWEYENSDQFQYADGLQKSNTNNVDQAVSAAA